MVGQKFGPKKNNGKGIIIIITIGIHWYSLLL